MLLLVLLLGKEKEEVHSARLWEYKSSFSIAQSMLTKEGAFEVANARSTVYLGYSATSPVLRDREARQEPPPSQRTAAAACSSNPYECEVCVRQHARERLEATGTLPGFDHPQQSHVQEERSMCDESYESSHGHLDRIFLSRFDFLLVLTVSVSVRLARVLGFALGVTFLVTRLGGSDAFLGGFRRCSKAGDAAGLESVHLTC